MTGPTDSAEGLDGMSTEELRRLAFERAEERHDLRFFWQLLGRLPSAVDASTEDGSSGSIGQTLADVVGMFRELTGREGFGEQEPLLREAFVDYLRRHGRPQV